MGSSLEKLQRLAQMVYDRDGKLTKIQREENPGPWHAWREWRKQHGEPVAYMDTVGTLTVPTEYPPLDLDAALRDNRPATLRERLGNGS